MYNEWARWRVPDDARRVSVRVSGEAKLAGSIGRAGSELVGGEPLVEGDRVGGRLNLSEGLRDVGELATLSFGVGMALDSGDWGGSKSARV